MDEDVVSACAALGNVVVISKNLEWPPSSFKVPSIKFTFIVFRRSLISSRIIYHHCIISPVAMDCEAHISPGTFRGIISERHREIN